VLIFVVQGNGGSSVSLPVTVKVQGFVYLLASVAVHVTVLTPLLKLLPLTGVQLTVAPAQLSLAVGVMKVTVRVQLPGAVLVVMFAGHVKVGSSVSVTVTVKVHAFVLPLASVAVHVTVLTDRMSVV